MSSILRIEASRANGAKSRRPVTVASQLASLANSAKSTRPVTSAGRAISSQNAVRHGILAESIVLDSESAECFSEVLSTLQEELQPASSVESRYVETMALAEWRRLRLICIEKEQIAIETERQESANLSGSAEVKPIRLTARAFRAMSDESRAQELLNRYESRYDRQYQRAFNGLRAYRADKRKDERDARRAQSARDRMFARRERSVLRDNSMQPKGEHTILREKQNNENAERSEPNIG
jgi:hypothetical protein